MGAHLAQVSLAGLAGGDAVVDRLDQQPQRGQRRAQVVGDGGDHLPPRRLDLAPRALLHREPDCEGGGKRRAGQGQGDEHHLGHAHPVRHGDGRGAGKESGNGDGGGTLHGRNL